MTPARAGRLVVEGFIVVRAAVSAPVLDPVSRAIDAELDRTGGRRHALRRLLERVGPVRDLAAHPAVALVVEAVLGPGAFAVRGIFFDKTPEANWPVAWHQDRTIVVESRADVPGFGPWSMKEGVPHVEPPVEVLERMLTVRVHIDDCGAENGPLRVLPGSHRLGRLDAGRIEGLVHETEEVACTLRGGDLLVLRPLLVHASSPAESPAHRRVVHLEYAARCLPAPLRLRTRVPVR